MGKVLSALAVLMLVFAGANFTHFNSGDHAHASTGQMHLSGAAHDHADHPAPIDQHDANPLHCGASILLLTENYEIRGACRDETHLPAGPLRLSENTPGFDPPPPRTIS